MNIFFDTSSLFKLYHYEIGSSQLIKLLNKYPNYNIYLSEITLVEIYSAVLKKVRTGDLSLEDSTEFLIVVDQDFNNSSFIKLDFKLLQTSQQLIIKYGLKGLRSLDSIQLASAIAVKSSVDLVLTSDSTLKSIFIEEGFNCEY